VLSSRSEDTFPPHRLNIDDKTLALVSLNADYKSMNILER